MTQKELFYKSHCELASKNHLKMAEMQRRAGKDELAKESEKTALARRITGRNINRNIKESFDFGDWAVKTNL